MTTTTLEPQVKPGAGSGAGHRHCEGCPRCQDANAGFCPYQHVEFGNRHPVCKVCGHCVLRGKHTDDGADLDQYRGAFFGPSHDIGRN